MCVCTIEKALHKESGPPSMSDTEAGTHMCIPEPPALPWSQLHTYTHTHTHMHTQAASNKLTSFQRKGHGARAGLGCRGGKGSRQECLLLAG